MVWVFVSEQCETTWLGHSLSSPWKHVRTCYSANFFDIFPYEAVRECRGEVCRRRNAGWEGERCERQTEHRQTLWRLLAFIFVIILDSLLLLFLSNHCHRFDLHLCCLSSGLTWGFDKQSRAAAKRERIKSNSKCLCIFSRPYPSAQRLRWGVGHVRQSCRQ